MIKITRGDYRELPFEIKDPDGNSIVPNDYESVAIRFTAKRYFSDTSAYITKTLDSGVVLLNPASNGTGVVIILSDDTYDIDDPDNSYVKLHYELRVQLNSLQPFTVDSGTLILSPSLSNGTI